MPAELGDERAFKRAMRTAAGEVGREEVNEAVRDAVRYANEGFRDAMSNPPEGASMSEWALEAIIDSLELYWEGGESEGKLAKGDRLIAEWTHEHTNKIEVGVQPHMIEGDPVLVFEWPGIPEDVAKQFESQWESPDSFLEKPMVAFARISHPGIPGVGAIRGGFQRALREHFS